MNQIKIDSSNFFESGTVLKLHYRRFGATIKIDDEMVEEKGFDSRKVKAVKDLFSETDKKLYLDCFSTLKHKTDGEIKKFSIALGIPGLRFIPNKTISGLVELLNGRKNQFENMKFVFLNQYETMIERAKEEDPLFNQEDYPSSDSVSSRFIFDWSIYQFDPPSNLPEDIMEAEKQKAKNNAERAVKRFLKDMLTEISDKIGKFSKRFDDRSVTPKALQPLEKLLSRMIENFGEYFDEDTEKLVKKLNKILIETDLELIGALEGEEKVKKEFETVEKLDQIDEETKKLKRMIIF